MYTSGNAYSSALALDAADGVIDGAYNGRPIVQAGGYTTGRRLSTGAGLLGGGYTTGLGSSSALALDAADGVIDGAYHGRPIVQSGGYSQAYPAYGGSSALALDAADGVIDGQYFGHDIIPSTGHKQILVQGAPEIIRAPPQQLIVAPPQPIVQAPLPMPVAPPPQNIGVRNLRENDFRNITANDDLDLMVGGRLGKNVLQKRRNGRRPAPQPMGYGPPPPQQRQVQYAPQYAY